MACCCWPAGDVTTPPMPRYWAASGALTWAADDAIACCWAAAGGVTTSDDACRAGEAAGEREARAATLSLRTDRQRHCSSTGAADAADSHWP